MYIVYTQIAFNHNLIMRLRNSNTDFCASFIGIHIFFIEMRGKNPRSEFLIQGWGQYGLPPTVSGCVWV